MKFSYMMELTLVQRNPGVSARIVTVLETLDATSMESAKRKAFHAHPAYKPLTPHTIVKSKYTIGQYENTPTGLALVESITVG